MATGENEVIEYPDEGEALGPVVIEEVAPRSAGDMMASLPSAVRGLGRAGVKTAVVNTSFAL